MRKLILNAHCQKVFVFLFVFIFLFQNTGLAYAATFTPNMAKRNAPGPFTVGVVSQKDLINYSHGTTIAGDDFSQNSDDDQGTVIFWWTPEFSSDTRDSGKSYFLKFRSTSAFYYDWALDRFYLGDIGSQLSLGDYDVIAGQTYLISLRWDKDNFVMNNTAVLSVNDTLVGETSAGSPVWEDDWGATNIEGADGLIEGLTIYRRPLFDGTYGIDVGNGDEIAQIYNSGSGKDPTLITGSWDVVFALPTNSSTGTLTTGTGNAWSHPHSSNLLYTSTTNTGGFMMNGNYATDGWKSIGALSSTNGTGNSLNFDGGDYVGLGDILDMNGGVNFTVSAWINGDSQLGSWGNIVGKCCEGWAYRIEKKRFKHQVWNSNRCFWLSY